MEKLKVKRKKDGSFVLLVNEKRTQVFLVYRSDFPIWNIPGGGIEPGETPEKAAVRESFEETGFNVKIIKKIGTYEYFDPKSKKLVNYSHLFEGRIISGKFTPEFKGCKGLWFNLNKIPVDVTNNTRIKINDFKNFKGKEFYKITSVGVLSDNLHLFLRHPLATIKFYSR